MRLSFPALFFLLLSLCLLHSACFGGPDSAGFYGRVTVPNSQEFRWSDGGLPQTFDPAYAAAPPDTDAVRAIFEGLTDHDPKTLVPVPGVAKHWESSEQGRVWTFYLRSDARWSNGEPVTAQDFVRSWQRTVRIGQLSPHTNLLTNIVGARSALVAPTPQQRRRDQETQSSRGRRSRSVEQSFGAQAMSDHVLRVRLRRADNNFPSLVAHSVFRPVKLASELQLQRLTPPGLVSNGAFALAKSDNDSVILERANQYWGRSDISLERVEFINTRDSEAALAAYRDGRVDAISNAPFEPLALKLLSSYKDFRRHTYGALTYYSFNSARPPFDDVRVREALSLAINRERISRDDLDGATEPARRFLPDSMVDAGRPVVDKSLYQDQDMARAKALLAEAGYPEGRGFPVVRLLINRNELQRIVAQSVAAMWSNVLNINTEIIIRNWDEYEGLLRNGDFDVARRGMVMQTTDEFTNIRMMFRDLVPFSASANQQLAGTPETSEAKRSANNVPVETESQALRQLRAIPIYFASSYTLVRPYVTGFDTNVLDAPSLKTVRIDTKWNQPGTAALMRP